MDSIYTEGKIREIVAAQRRFFRSGETLPIRWRIQQLKRLKAAVLAHEKEFEDALAEDLGRSTVEAYLCDIGPIIVEINEMLAGLRRWARPECHFSGLMCFPSTVTKVYKMPYGVSLVISPFNFPILLTIGVVAAAMEGGNTVVIKSSSKSAASTAALKKFFAEVFPPEYVTLIDGGHDVADLCLAQRFDKIFYTGSPAVGKHVLAEAAKNLTPVALELGGETGNWCVVRKDADLKDTARKIAFFKLTNAGQICININQIAVAEEVAEPFLAELKQAFVSQIGEHAEENPEYPKLITSGAYDKCARLADKYRDRIVFGGVGNPETRRYAPTMIYPVGIDEHIVQHELFCPLLPIVPFKDADGPRASAGDVPVHPGHAVGESRDADAAVRRRLHQRGVHPYDGEGSPVQRHRPFRHGRLPRRMGFPGVHPPPDRPERPHPLQPAVKGAPLQRESG